MSARVGSDAPERKRDPWFSRRPNAKEILSRSPPPPSHPRPATTHHPHRPTHTTTRLFQLANTPSTP
jgi:hypothetical protein